MSNPLAGKHGRQGVVSAVDLNEICLAINKQDEADKISMNNDVMNKQIKFEPFNQLDEKCPNKNLTLRTVNNLKDQMNP